MKKIESNILEVLDRCSINENVVKLPDEVLDRPVYMSVNKCLESIGGKWNRKEQGFLFPEPPDELLDGLITTGEIIDLKKLFQFYPTPVFLAEKMIQMADLKDTDLILEPSAGQGGIADLLPNKKNVWICELDEKNCNILKKKGYTNIYQKDFLRYNDVPCFDKIVMNPPFSRQQDIDHVLNAFKHLKSGGVLVAIMSEGTFFRQNKKSVDFRQFMQDLDDNGGSVSIIANEQGAFKVSGTMVNTRIIKLVKK